MKKTMVTVVIEFEGELDKDIVLMAVSEMLEPGLNSQETYSVVEVDYIDE
jgi:hypothetical protein